MSNPQIHHIGRLIYQDFVNSNHYFCHDYPQPLTHFRENRDALHSIHEGL